MFGGALPDLELTSPVVQVDRLRGIAEYLATPADPMQWVWLGVIALGLVVLIVMLVLINKSQQKKREARRRLRRFKRQKAKDERPVHRTGVLTRRSHRKPSTRR